MGFKDMISVAYGDSACGNAVSKSQRRTGHRGDNRNSFKIESNAPRSLLSEWKSYRCQRVLRSTLAVESASLDKAEDSANFLGCILALDANFHSSSIWNWKIPSTGLPGNGRPLMVRCHTHNLNLETELVRTCQTLKLAPIARR